jgi:predicted acetylornithine/succinylornithine family transaminase
MTALPAAELALSTSVPTPDALLPIYKRAPMEFVRGAGCELFDADGRAYLDFVSGIAVNALGYDDRGIRETMLAAMESGMLHVSNLYSTSPGARLAAALVDRSFASSVFFCNSGAEANEGAFKFARRWARTVGGPAKHEIVALRGSFHGRLFASLAATDRPAYRAPFRPLAGGVTIAERSLEELETLLNAETVAAVILEPVQGEGGVRVLDGALLEGIREVTRARQIALIFDEIQCGLGRTGRLFAYERAGVTPDLLTLAKPLAGGLPMGAVLLGSQIAETIQPGDHATTFGGGPFVASVALHVVERLSDPSLLAHVRGEGAWMGSQLDRLVRTGGPVRAVRGVGFMWGIDVVEPAASAIVRAREAGLLICSAGDHTIRLLPPLIAGRSELQRGLDILRHALAA